MANEKLTMTVDIRAQIDKFNKSMSEIKNNLVQAFSGKGVKNYTEELNKITRLMDKINLDASKPLSTKTEFNQMQKDITNVNTRIQRLIENLQGLNNLSFNERLSYLPEVLQNNYKKATDAVKDYIKALNSLKTEEGKIDSNKQLDDVNKEIKAYEKRQKMVEDFEKKVASAGSAKDKSEAAREEADRLQRIVDFRKATEEATAAQEKLKEVLKEGRNGNYGKIKRSDLEEMANLQMQGKSIKEASFFSPAVEEAAKQQRASRKTEVAPAQKARAEQEARHIEKLKKETEEEAASNKKVEESVKKLSKANSVAEEKIKAMVNATAQQIEANKKLEEFKGQNYEEIEESTEELTEKIKFLRDAQEAYNDSNKEETDSINKKINRYEQWKKELEENAEAYEQNKQKREELIATLKDDIEQKKILQNKKLIQSLEEVGISEEKLGDISQMDTNQLKQLIQQLYEQEIVTPQVAEATNEFNQKLETTNIDARNVAKSVNESAESFEHLTERAQNIDQITSRIKYFVGFAGVINVARKSLRSAVSTIKELDKAMTQMAVVTKSTISDYWEQLPKYTERANKLGATIRDMYEADTLYYQQGLKTNQVMQVANETMKMARIAGLGAAEATDRMTNALRGFNMEINEASAERINDVYSKLAAITASNVDEISTAMTKTASIAHSAGMEFETTAAFLSQIIETTRESAETAGTALKTVIARFQELKKAPSEIGEIEGEVVDANKIEGALRTVGVALRDSEGQFRKLDDVFIELAGKWGSLDKNTQRYIATIAAGSRQQSRFIALMQDYSHTVELVDAAYNSAGVSQEQYEKTLDSLQTKINALTNAWDTFTMSLFDSRIVKTAIDTGKNIINVINTVLDKLDFLHTGILKIVLVATSVNKLGSAFKIFTHQLSQDGGTIANSFGAIGKAIKNSLTPKYISNIAGVQKALEAFKVAGADVGEEIENIANMTNLDADSKERLRGLLWSVNKEELTQEQLTRLCAIATEENTEATAKEIITEEGLVVADNTVTKAKTKVILASKLQALAQSKLFKILTLGIGPTLANSAATAVLAGNYAKAALCVAGVTAAFAAFVAIVYVVYKAIQALIKTRLDNRLKDAQQRVEEFTNSIKDCKDALSDLEDAQEKYNSIHDELKQNIQGTEEWKKKLIEANEQVYELIQKYPILNSYIERLPSGELTITEAGWNAVTTQQNQNLEVNRVAQFNAQQDSYRIQQEKEGKALANSVKDGFNDVIQSLATNPDNVSSILNLKNLSSVIEETMLSGESIAKYRNQIDEIGLSSEALEAFNQYQESVDKNTLALDLLREQMAQGETQDEKDAWMVLNKAFDNYELNDTYIKKQVKAFRDTSDYQDDEYVQKIAKYIADKNGVTVSSILSGNDRKTLTNMYTGMFNITDENQINNISKKARYWFGNERDTLIKEIVEAYERAILQDSTGAKLDSYSSDEVSALAHSKNLSSLTKDEAFLLDKINSKGTEEAVSKALEEQLNASGVGTFFDLYWSNLEKISKESAANIKDLLEMGDVLSLDQLDDYARLVSRENSMGLGSVDFSSLPKELLSELFSFDTSSIEDLELARKALTDKWPLLTDRINKTIDDIIRLGGAISKVDLETLIDRVGTLSGELAKLNEYQQGNVFSEEQKNKYLNSGVATEEDFLSTVDGNYVYLKPLEELRNSIVKNTEALQDRTKELDNQYELAQKYRMATPEFGVNPYENINTFIRDNLSLIASTGLISGISENTKFENLSASMIEQITQELERLRTEMKTSDYQEGRKKLTDTLAEGYSSYGTSATNLSEYFASDSGYTKEGLEKAGILNLLEGQEGYDSLIEKLNKLGKISKEDTSEYSDLLKTLSNKKDILTAQDGMKKMVNSAKTFGEEYSKLGDNIELKMAYVLDQAKNLGLEGINLTRDNYDMYAQLFTQFGEGNMEAYKAIATLMLQQQGLTSTQIEAFWAGTLEITSDSLKAIATMAQSFGFGFTEVDSSGKAFLKAFNDMGGFVSTSSGGGADKWEDPYNWLWNINKRINKEIFERERLERKYQKAVEDATKSEKDLYEVSKKELQNLERQAQLERDKGTKAMQEAQMMMNQRPDFANYVSWDTVTGQIQVDYSSIDKLGWGSDRGSAFEDFVGRLEELIDEVQDSQTTLEEIEDLTEDIKNRGREQYLELQDRIKNALVEINQRQIDTAEKINESIKSAQDELLNKIQEEISETRQIRSNQEKEQELEDKRQRLNYLRRDTTGANATQIKQLEKELSTGEQQYTDSLTDQTLSNIQKANQKAEEQRQEQIEIMNNQLTRWQETGAIWETVNASIQEGFDNPDNFLNSQVGGLLATAENKRALSELQQADWEKDLENQAKLAELFNNGELYQQGEQTLTQVQRCADELQTAQESIRKIGNLNQGLEQLLEVYPKSYADKVSNGVSGISADTSKMLKYFEELLNKNENKYSGGSVGDTGGVGNSTHNKPFLVRYATGGLNTNPGLAQLDGTLTEPEYILNSDQTKAFFNLVNTLTSNEGKSGVSGDNYFDIDINVDELSNDYDVENIADKIKQMIWEDSQYRNVNLVSLLR